MCGGAGGGVPHLSVEGWVEEEQVSKNCVGASSSAQQVLGREVSALDTAASPSPSSRNIACYVLLG